MVDESDDTQQDAPGEETGASTDRPPGIGASQEEMKASSEELLSMSEELATVNHDIQNLLAATGIATLFLNRELRILRFTPPLEEILNVRQDDLGRRIGDLTHRLEYSSLVDDARRVLDTLVAIEREIASQDGRHFLMRVRPYRSSQDRIGGVVITFVDITEQTRNEVALRESEERFRLVAECAREFAIFMLDPGGRVVSWNPGAERITGYTDDEIIGEHFEVIFTEEDRAAGAPQRELEKAARDGQAPDERWHRCRDGSRFWANGVVVALREEDGRLRGFAKLMEDETERKLAEDALRESEAKYRTLFDSIDEGFCVIEMIFGEDGTPTDYAFLETNPAFERHTGLTAAAGKRIRQLAPDHEDHWFAAYGRIARTGQPERFVNRARELGDRWFDVYAFRIGEPGEQKVAVLFKDITQQRQTLDELEVLTHTLEQRVEDRTREVQELASHLTMAEQEERRRIARVLHDDLQQVLFGLHLRLEYLSRDMGELGHEDLRQGFADARDWLTEAIETTRQLSVDLSPPILKNEGLLEALRWLVGQVRQKHQIDVRLDLDSGARIEDEDVRSLLFQAVRELLFNVVKHAGVDEATVALSQSNDRVLIEVSDRGRGFDLDEARSRAAGHGGFGLFSVAERLRLIGGEMHIQSSMGHGTRVRLTAPARLT